MKLKYVVKTHYGSGDPYYKTFSVQASAENFASKLADSPDIACVIIETEERRTIHRKVVK